MIQCQENITKEFVMDVGFWELLKKHGTRIETAKGYYLKMNAKNDPDACIYLLDEGICALNSLTRKGDENIYLYFHAKRLIGFNQLLISQPLESVMMPSAHITIVTKTPCVLYQINFDTFSYLIQNNRELNLFFIQTLADNYSEALNHFHYIHEENLVTALCQLLLSVCRREPGQRPSVPKFYTYEELARYLGCHPVTISRIMAKLRQLGYLQKSGRELIISREEDLVRLMDSDAEFKY